MQRREFVAGAAASTTVMLAGCGLLGGDGGGNSPEGAVEDYYDSINEQDQDAADDVLHSESPIRPLEDPSDESADIEVDVQSTEVTDDDPGEEAISNEFGNGLYEVEELVSIADGADDVAIVEAELETTFNDETNTGTEVHLTATEDGDWKVVV